MDIKSIIQKKRERKELNRDEIRYFVSKYAREEITDAQVAALMSYIYINGLTENEILELVKAMAESGTTIDLSEISDNIVDKHSTGGVGDKVTIILMPVIAALGIPVAKISSRGYGISGGTIDKLESIPGFDADITIDEFKEIIKKVGVSIIEQNFNLAPVEGKMYKLRNQIACSDSLPLIAASLMSLKLATGGNKFVFDITCGRGTYIKTREDAKRLARLLNRLGKSLGKEVGCVITSMDEPLGYAVGNSLEVIEAIQSLKGDMPEDVKKVVLELGAYMIKLAGKGEDIEENKARLLENIENGKGYEKFIQLVENQGGDASYIRDTNQFPKANYIENVYSQKSGYIQSMHAKEIGKIVCDLGAGRIRKEDSIDNTVGIILNKKVSDKVEKEDLLVTIYANSKEKLEEAKKKLLEVIKIEEQEIEKPKMILEIMK